MVHHRILPRPGQHLNDREFRCSALGIPGIGSAGDRRRKCQPGGSIGRPERRVYYGNSDGGGVRGHVGPLPPATETMVPGREDMDHGPVGEEGAVPDGLNSGDISSSL